MILDKNDTVVVESIVYTTLKNNITVLITALGVVITTVEDRNGEFIDGTRINTGYVIPKLISLFLQNSDLTLTDQFLNGRDPKNYYIDLLFELKNGTKKNDFIIPVGDIIDYFQVKQPELYYCLSHNYKMVYGKGDLTMRFDEWLRKENIISFNVFNGADGNPIYDLITDNCRQLQFVNNGMEGYFGFFYVDPSYKFDLTAVDICAINRLPNSFDVRNIYSVICRK